jgi:hypothetical protein
MSAYVEQENNQAQFSRTVTSEQWLIRGHLADNAPSGTNLAVDVHL